MISSLKVTPFVKSRKFLYLLISHLFSGAALIFINVFLANTVTQTEFGIFAWIYAASMVISQLAIFGSGTHYLNKYGKDHSDELLNNASGPSFIILNFIFICICVLMTSVYLGYMQFAYFACCLISFIAVQISLEMHILRCQIKNLYKLQAIIFFIPNGLRLLSLLATFYLIKNFTFDHVILLLSAINLFLFIAFLWKWAASTRMFFLSISWIKYLAHFYNVLPRGLAEGSFMIYTQLPVLAVAYAFSIEESGIFAISLTFATVFLMPSAVFTKAFSPLLYIEANKDKKSHYKLVLNFLYSLAVMGLIMSLSLYFLADSLVVFFLDDSFNSSMTIIKILSFYIFTRYLNTAISYSMYTHTFSKTYAKIVIAMIMIQISFFSFAVSYPILSLNQAAWMMCVTEIMMFAITFKFLLFKAFDESPG